MREDGYVELFSDYFEIRPFSNEHNLIENGLNAHYDLLVIDNILKGWSGNRDQDSTDGKTVQITMSDLLEHYTELTENKTPIIAVSKQWAENLGHRLWNIGDIARKYPVISTIAWQDFGKFNYGSIEHETWITLLKDHIYRSFLLYWKRQEPLPNKDDDICVLQLSDLQFGAQEEVDAYADITRIKSELNEKGVEPNIIIICGDIVQNGKCIQFEQADMWIKRIAKKLEPEISAEKIIFAIGNHDCDFSAFAALEYEYDFQISEFVKTQDQGWCVPKNKYVSTEEHIFSNYLLFEKRYYSMNSPAVFRTKKLSTVNDRFVNWGIRLITLNTVTEISPCNHSGIGVDKEELDDIINYCIGSKHENIYTILVSHYSPIDLGYENSDSKKQNLWKAFEQLLKQVKINLWLCGHSHTARRSSIEIGDNGDIKIPYSKTSTLRLSREHIPSGAKRGYNIVKLKRSDGIVKAAEIEIINLD